MYGHNDGKGKCDMEYRSLNSYMKERFGCKVYKLAINGGFTCPNRDGTIDSRGCIFCSGYGSGDFAEDASLSVTKQIELGKKRVESKMPSGGNGAKSTGKYIAFFQAFTNTYAPVERLRELFTEAIKHPDVVVLSIATRPDCLGEDVLELLSELNEIKPVWVELGLQTIHEKSAEYIRRGYPLKVYEEAVVNLRKRGIEVITHVILGLPGETKEDMLETVRYVGGAIKLPYENAGKDTCSNAGVKESKGENGMYRVQGIKLQLLHVIEGTDLAKDYREGKFECLELDEYVELVRKCIEALPRDMVIHRMTGDGAKKTLVAPLWSADKKRVLNALNNTNEQGGKML
jgi:hypothetical protein